MTLVFTYKPPGDAFLPSDAFHCYIGREIPVQIGSRQEVAVLSHVDVAVDGSEARMLFTFDDSPSFVDEVISQIIR